MAPPRHKRVKPRSNSRRIIRVALPVAAVATLASSTAAVAWPHREAASTTAISRPQALRATVDPGDWQSRTESISRSEERVELEPKPEPTPSPTPTPSPEPEPAPEVVGHKFLTAPLNVWSGPGESYELLDVLPFGTKVAVTGQVDGGWAEVVIDDASRWVNAAYLADEKPQPEPEATSGGLSSAPCASGSDVESGLTENAIAVHRAVCAEFPEITSYGGIRPGDDGEHGTGQALDIMITDDATGDAIAEFVKSNYDALGVSEVLWSQQIWTVERGSEGWRWMEDRGSTTANHYDHVHVTVY